MRSPPVDGEFPLVLIPFRSLLHMETDDDRRAVLRAVRGLLAPDGRFIFDVFAPGADDIAETHGRWVEREPGIWERAEWDERARTLILRVRGPGSEAEMSLAWLAFAEWREVLGEEGFAVETVYGWFDRTPWRGGEDSIWVCRLPSSLREWPPTSELHRGTVTFLFTDIEGSTKLLNHVYGIDLAALCIRS